jgi:hypothetical protein
MHLIEDCACKNEQCPSGAFEITEVWRENVNGITSRIEVWHCGKCDSYWLRYSTEHETSMAWGKWFRGPVSAEAAHSATAESAAEIFRKMPWHFYGGPYYRTTGERSFGPVHVGFGGELAAAA